MILGGTCLAAGAYAVALFSTIGVWGHTGSKGSREALCGVRNPSYSRYWTAPAVIVALGGFTARRSMGLESDH